MGHVYGGLKIDESGVHKILLNPKYCKGKLNIQIALLTAVHEVAPLIVNQGVKKQKKAFGDFSSAGILPVATDLNLYSILLELKYVHLIGYSASQFWEQLEAWRVKVDTGKGRGTLIRHKSIDTLDDALKAWVKGEAVKVDIQLYQVNTPVGSKITVTIDKASSVAGDVPENTQKTLPKWHKK